MTRNKVIALSATAALLATANASNAASIVALGGEKAEKKETITAIGSAPVKKKKDLKLGALRTRDAELPGGTRTLSERMKLRAKKAIERQRAVTSAKRKKPKKNDDGAEVSVGME